MAPASQPHSIATKQVPINTLGRKYAERPKTGTTLGLQFGSPNKPITPASATPGRYASIKDVRDADAEQRSHVKELLVVSGAPRLAGAAHEHASVSALPPQRLQLRRKGGLPKRRPVVPEGRPR